MSVAKETEAQWIRLNECQRRAEQIGDERPERDFERRPWTAEDNENMARMVQTMTGQLARIEQRLDVLYLISRPILSAVNILWLLFILIAVFGVADRLLP